jgi:hypothetical protein
MIIILIQFGIIVTVTHNAASQAGIVVTAETAAVYIIVIVSSPVNDFKIGITVFLRLLSFPILACKVHVGVVHFHACVGNSAWVLAIAVQIAELAYDTLTADINMLV